MDDSTFYMERISEIIPVQQEQLEKMFQEFLELDHIYGSAAQTVETQLHIYDN